MDPTDRWEPLKWKSDSWKEDKGLLLFVDLGGGGRGVIPNHHNRVRYQAKMVYPRPSFGGRPPRSSQYNPHPCADGPAFSQQAGFLRPYSTNGSGPRNNGESWNTWHNPNRSNRSNNNNNHHDGRRDFENLHRVRRDSFVSSSSLEGGCGFHPVPMVTDHTTGSNSQWQ